MRKFKDLIEARGDVGAFTLGRFNPPTTGHEKLIMKLDSVAKKNSASMYVFPTHSNDPARNPLPHGLKVAYMKKMYKKYAKNIQISKARNVFEVAKVLYDKGHKSIIMVVGSDRVAEFTKLLDTYNGVKSTHGFYEFDNIQVLSAGERDPDAEGVSGMSASKMRAAAADGDKDAFVTGVPKSFKDGEKLYRDVRKNMGIREERDMGDMSDFEQVRDAYLTGKIWNVGDVVESKGFSGEVVRKGTNYLSFVSEDGKVHKAWLHDIQVDEARMSALDKLKKFDRNRIGGPKIFKDKGVEFIRMSKKGQRTIMNVPADEFDKWTKKGYKVVEDVDFDEAMGSMRPETGVKGTIITKLAIDMSRQGMSDTEVFKQMKLLRKKKLPELKKLAKELQMRLLKKEDVDLDEDASVYKKTARKNKNDVTYAFGRTKKLDGQPKENGGYWVWKLSKNYDGKVRGGIRNSWVYVAKDLSYSDAVKLMNKKLGRKEFKEEVDLDEASIEFALGTKHTDGVFGTTGIEFNKDFKVLTKKLGLKVVRGDEKTKSGKPTARSQRFATVSGSNANISKLLKTMRMVKDKDGFPIKEEVDLDERNYAKEYANYQGTPEQIARRSSRNKARRVMGDKTKIGMDVGHKDNDPLNNSPDNLRNEDPSINRREPRLRDEGITDTIPFLRKLTLITHPKGMENLTKKYTELALSPKYKGRSNQAAADLARQTKDVSPKEFINYINKLVKKGVLPKELKAEKEIFSFKEFVDSIQEVKQDKDIDDKKGTQPAKYYAGDMAKSTKDKRDAHFKKKKSGPAPGDSAETKPSVHTKKFKQMFGEKSIDEKRAKQAVAGRKVQKLVTAHGLKFKGKVYKEIDMELVKINNSTEMVTFNIIHPPEIFGNETNISFKALKRGPFMATDTSKINEVLPDSATQGDYIDDFVNSDAPQFKGRSKEKRKEMAIAAYLSKNEEFQLDEKIQGLVNKAEKSGMPYGILKKVYDRGLAAFKTGHRPGATPQQWAFARVNSFVTKSAGTWGKADKDLAKQVEMVEACWDTHKQVGMKKKGGKMVPNCVPRNEEPRIPRKKGQPAGSDKHSDLYTDENPKGTIQGLGFKDVETAKSSVKKIIGSGKTHAHKIQAAIAMEQRAKEMGKSAEAAVYRKYIDKMKQKTKEMQEDVKSFNKWGEITEKDDKSGKELNNPTKGDVKKYKVYVRNNKGNVVKVEFGDPNMEIKRDDPARRKAFRARHNCDQKKDKTTAGYWSCKFWSGKSVTDLMKG